jgi:hypothetical protein
LLRKAVKLYIEAAKAARTYGQDVFLEALIYIELSYTYACLERWLEAEEQYKLALDTLDRGNAKIADPQAYVRLRASILETASQIHFDKGQAESSGSRSPLALEEYKVAYEWAREEIELLQQSSRENVRLIVAYINAGDYLSAMSKCENCPIPEAFQKARAYWQTARDAAHRLGLGNWEDEAQARINQS